MNTTISRVLAIGAALLAPACTSVGPQVVSGVVELGSFRDAPSSVRVVRAGQTVVESPVALDGSFSLTIPPGQGYRIELYAPSAAPGLVFPRRAGTVGASFSVRGGTTPFDLGTVRFIGDPTVRTYTYVATAATPGALLSSAATGDCAGGVDQSTGAVCVDDDDDEGATVCEEDDDGEDHQCEDGIDPATGAECDGGPAANADGAGAEAGGEDDALPSEAAVADHNLPSAIGCGEDDGEDED